ncbi:hypothetical protein LWI29_035231 [Acer saccharum]|uniref:Uncharacterized protein n=1 Tax=Acer saccharum TaxID=4024 RepID=A0AA39TB83_ACESA|nr:hypothetical protein LWI29_035231 [Acer saccharum]
MLLYHERSTNIALRRATFRAPSRAEIYKNIAMSSYMSIVECQLLNSLRRATLLTPSQAKVLGTLQLPSQTTNYNNSELAYYRQIGIISRATSVELHADCRATSVEPHVDCRTTSVELHADCRTTSLSYIACSKTGQSFGRTLQLQVKRRIKAR